LRGERNPAPKNKNHQSAGKPVAFWCVGKKSNAKTTKQNVLRFFVRLPGFVPPWRNQSRRVFLVFGFWFLVF